jgi:hypothetical protein
MRFLSRVSRWTSAAASALGMGGGGAGKGAGSSSRIEKLKADNAALKVVAATNAAVTAAKAAAAASHARLAKKYGSELDPFEYLSAVDYGLGDGSLLSASATETGEVGEQTTARANRSDTNSDLLASIKMCVAEVTAQYCEGRRGSEAAEEEGVEEKEEASTNAAGESDESVEPYCARVTQCWQEDFKPKACRPTTCPLHQAGCAFTSICLNSEVLEQFSSQKSAAATSKAATAKSAAEQQQVNLGAGKEGAEVPSEATTTTWADIADAVAKAQASAEEEGVKAGSSTEASSSQDENVVDPAVAAAAAAASAAATGIGGAHPRPAGGGRRSGPRRRSLWDADTPPAGESESPLGSADGTGGEGTQNTKEAAEMSEEQTTESPEPEATPLAS